MDNLLLLASAHVSPWITVLFALLLVGLIACLALEEILHAKKSVIAGSFAIVCLFLGAVCGVLPFEEIVVGSHEVVEHEGLHGRMVVGPDDHPEQIDLDAHHHKQGDSSPPRDGSVPDGGVPDGGVPDGGVPDGGVPDGGVQPATDADRPRADEAGVEQHELHADGHRLAMPVYIPGIDWSVIAIILGSSLFVDVTSKSGLFTWIALKVTKLSGGDPVRLLYFYGVMTVVFSAVLNNVTAMIIIGSLTVVSLERLGRRDKLLAFLLIEGLLTNIGGLLTLISSVPNIIVGTAADISFVTFLIKSTPYVIVATWITIWLGTRLFKIEKLKTAEQRKEAREQVAAFDETDGVQSWGFFWFATGMLVLFILVIATTSALPYVQNLQMGFVAMAFAGVMLLRYKSEADNFYKAIDWDLIGFFMALFVVIYVMEHAQVLNSIGHGLEWVLYDMRAQPAHPRDASVLLVGASCFSSVTDNIPLSAMLANILKSLGTPASSGLWWSVIFGANLGGNFTPIGSASTLVAVTIIHKHGLHLSFLGFVKAAWPFALVQTILAMIYVLVFLR